MANLFVAEGGGGSTAPDALRAGGAGRAWRHPQAIPRATWAARFAALRRLWATLLLFALIIGMYGGCVTVTVTEAEGVGAVTDESAVIPLTVPIGFPAIQALGSMRYGSGSSW